MSYHGWGRFSKKFLEEITIPAPETGEVWNLITALWETNENLSQLLGKKYQFSDQIKEYNEEQNNPTLSYKTVEEQYVSPAVKRQIWQTLQVIKEIKKVMGKEPERIFVEMARESQESKRTESRKKHLMDLYKVCKEEEKEIYEKLEKHEEQHLRKDKLFLYYTQRGHCMYSGERIEFDDLWDNTKYDIDHIYPQSKTRYVLSDADIELGISKNMDIVFDIFSIDINSKKIVNKLYEEMQQVAYSEKLYVKTQEIAQSIQKYILELEQETDYILTFTEDVDWMAIFKALRVQHEIIEEDYFEKLIRYIKVATVAMKYKIFVFVNLRSYLSDLQMQKLIQEAIHQEVKLIFVENCVKDCMEGGLRYIIDRDQCEIY